ncbi:uncharacterized protein PHACADRAFT_255600 [Phanerochaete carnosa HHB-10118-sp]|uniref:MARVEL domain-containing protein n=1 Tax=Phanerochaete carnosa (strain HHB-10118-sp) TaxID=650164 RepID=K5VUF7_PHACS|nr:uncharacterized protein PHACADRAFT_255600 [Phanerochaete carnosa HHB-10118-sp]EKM55168.1 hypothetical protein PHACADRAFT_255600 [Phanerochaete carnosa HHB-10118-sp]
MYAPNRLDTPPPASRFRRPWSPEPFDPNPPRNAENGRSAEGYTQHGFMQRREPSDVSIEALDLADYARQLARSTDPRSAPAFQPVFQAYDSYPPSPQPLRPLASRDSLSSPPNFSPSSPRHHFPPFSLPASTASASTRYNTLHNPPTQSSRPSQSPDYGHDPLLTPLDFEHEVDIAQPRGLYNPTADYFNAKPLYTSPEIDPFDPDYGHDSFRGLPPAYSSPRSSNYGHRLSKDVVPWGSESVAGAPIDPEIKAERVRALERQFGEDAKEVVDEEHMIGSVDAKGKLITTGPKKRVAVRCLQVLLSLLAAGSGIYSAAFIKTSTPPPPAGTAQAYSLYVVSVITFLLATYLFIIYPACCGSRTRKSSSFTDGPEGMMVLPVPGMPGGKQKGKKGKKGKVPGEGVQVNLIVDPGMFGGRREDDYSDEDADTESEYTGPRSFGGPSRERRRARRARRRGVFAGLALEAQWKEARKRLKINAAVDAVMVLLWGAEFVFILWGKRCPSGQFDGWCDAYNLATAAACLLCLAFGLSIFFEVKDLYASKASPRTRT